MSLNKKDSTKIIKNNKLMKDLEETETFDKVIEETIKAKQQRIKKINSNTGPYINTELMTSVTIHPRQMDNNIYKHLKENLVSKLEGKCYNKYGYISKVFKILKYSKGIIVPENPTASALFDVKFSCKLCRPIKKRVIVCKIQKITKMFFNASNGPITVIVTMDRLNSKNFFFDQKLNKLFVKDTNGSKEILAGSYVKILLENVTFNDMDKIIMAIGNLQSLATHEEIKESFDNEYGTDEGTLVNFDKYITNDEEAEMAQQAVEEDIKDKNDNINGTLKSKE